MAKKNNNGQRQRDNKKNSSHSPSPLLDIIKSFFTSEYRFWNYLRTPYFMPMKALDEIICIDQQQVNEGNFDAFTTVPQQTESVENCPFSARELKTRCYDNGWIETKLFGTWKLPYALGHSLWFLLSFLPNTHAHKMRLEMATNAVKYQKAIISKLNNLSDEKNTLEIIAIKQQLRPWSYIVGAMEGQSTSLHERATRATNMLYRTGIYVAAALLITLGVFAAIALIASGAFGPASAGFMASVVAPALLSFLTANVTVLAAAITLGASAVAASLCINEIFNPGSLVKALSRTLALVSLQYTSPFERVTELTYSAENKYKEKVEAKIQRYTKYTLYEDNETKAQPIKDLGYGFMRSVWRILGLGIVGALVIPAYQLLKAIVATSPLVLPLYASKKEMPGKTPDKHHVSNAHGEEYEMVENYSFSPLDIADTNYTDGLLKRYADFIPSGNIQDITLLRALLNPFQLLQMTFTWVTLSTLMLTDGLAWTVSWIPGVKPLAIGLNGFFKGAIYGIYALAFTALNIPKQLLALGTHVADSPVNGLYELVDMLNTQADKDRYDEYKSASGSDEGHESVQNKSAADEGEPSAEDISYQDPLLVVEEENSLQEGKGTVADEDLFTTHPEEENPFQQQSFTNLDYFSFRIKAAFKEAGSTAENGFAKLKGFVQPSSVKYDAA